LLGAWLNGAYQGFIICFLKKDLLMITTLTPQKPSPHSLHPDQRLNGRKNNPKNMGGNTVSPPLKNPKKIEKKRRKNSKKKKGSPHWTSRTHYHKDTPIYTHGFTTETQGFLRDCGDGCHAILRLHVAACGQRRCA
jgi:hypothetical protein